jgi:hypothetical protein
MLRRTMLPSSVYEILLSTYRNTHYHSPEDGNPSGLAFLLWCTSNDWTILIRIHLSSSARPASDSGPEFTERFAH